MVRLMNDHALNALKGWPSPTAVDITAKMSAAALAATAPDPVFAGRCGHLNNDKQFALGVPNGISSGKVYMPIFFFHNSDDPDVQNDGGVTGSATTDNPEGWAGVMRGNQLGFVATGAYELETTEFDTDDDYEPNHTLKAAVADDGVLSLGTPHTDPIVGIVSRGVRLAGQQPMSRNRLAFWPWVMAPSA